MAASSDNRGGDASGCGILWFVVVLLGILLPCVGLGYKSLRFAANYNVTTTKLVACDADYHADRTGRYYVFALELEDIDFPIRHISSAQTPALTEVFKRMPPKHDWCQFVDRDMVVYYDNHVRKGIVFADTPGSMNLLQLAWRIETGGGAIGLVLMPIIVFLVGASGLWLFVKESKALYTALTPATAASDEEPSISDDTAMSDEGATHQVVRWAAWLNRQVLPTVSVVLAGILTAVLGVVLAKGALFIEGTNNYVLGAMLLVGLAIAMVGPAFLVRAVHAVRTTRHPVFVLIRNVLVIAALSRLLMNTVTLLSQRDFSDFDTAGVWQFLGKVAEALLS